MKLKKLLPLLLALCLLPAACGKTPADGGATLTVMGKPMDLKKSYMTRVFDRYEQATGVKIVPVPVDDSAFEDTAAKALASGKGPDILMHFHNADLDAFDVEKDFLPLTDQPWVEELTEGARAYCTDARGDLLGLPFWESSVSGCYYNKTVLDSLGLRPASTQAEFNALCAALKEAGMTPLCWPADGCAWMIQFALDPLFADDPENLAAINENKLSYADLPQVADMFTWIDAAYKAGWMGSDSMTTGWDQIGPVMASGDAVMTFIWDTWFYTAFTPGKYSMDDFALMPVFLNTTDAGTYEGGNLNMMMVNKNSPNVDTALDFLAFCASPENYNAAFEGISTVSCFVHQTTNIQSHMVTDAQSSLASRERASTASSRIRGYKNDDVVDIVRELFSGMISPQEAVAHLDASRLRQTAPAS